VSPAVSRAKDSTNLLRSLKFHSLQGTNRIWPLLTKNSLFDVPG
jgi:hypothetical protein